MTNRNIPSPRQDQLVDIVRRYPGIETLAAAELVAPNGARHFGYLTVKRALRNGRIRQVCAKKGNVKHLYVEEGE